MPRPSLGRDSKTSAAPTPHSPPMAIPNSVRNTSSTWSEGANAQASSMTEKPRIFATSTGRRAVVIGQHSEEQSTDRTERLP